MVSLFDTVPEDVLKFGRGPSFQPKLVAELLELKKPEVSRLASVAQSSVRYDEHIPSAVREKLEDVGLVCNQVAVFFDGDPIKTALWFKTKNPMLGDVSPRDMVRLGRTDRLRKFIITALAERNINKSYSVEKQLRGTQTAA
jgi:hypothetical protein